jgi:hypothetical protein
MRIEKLAENMTVAILTDHIYILFSYTTPVAAYISGLEYLRTSTNHSVTTEKHIVRWLNGATPIYRTQSFFDRLAKDVAMHELGETQAQPKPQLPHTLISLPKRKIDL